MSKKQTYKIRNWKDYNKSLVNRGSLTVWFDKNSIANWYNKERTGKKGRPVLYSDASIQCCLTLKALFKMPLRSTQGFVSSLLELLGLNIKAPDYSSLSLRQKNLEIELPKSNDKLGSMHLVVDSTGAKLYGEGEWKVRMHGKSKRRSWLKIHLGINEKTKDIEASVLTSDNVHDCEVRQDIVDQVDGDIYQLTGDGAYDTHDSYMTAVDAGAKPCFPPRENAKRHKAKDEGWRLRNHAVSEVRYKGSKFWKQKNNYHRRSIAENAMFRFKQLFGDKISARTFDRQATEVQIKCCIINKINTLGMPVSVAA